MVGAQDALEGGQDLLVQGDRLGGAARRLVGDGEVVTRGQGVGVVGARTRSRAARTCSCKAIASAVRPAAWYALARLLREVRVNPPGESGDSICWESVRHGTSSEELPA